MSWIALERIECYRSETWKRVSYLKCGNYFQHYLLKITSLKSFAWLDKFDLIVFRLLSFLSKPIKSRNFPRKAKETKFFRQNICVNSNGGKNTTLRHTTILLFPMCTFRSVATPKTENNKTSIKLKLTNIIWM